MIYSWGKKSSKNRVLLDHDLQRVADRALGYGIMDFMIDCSFRDEATQNFYYFAVPQKSKVRWPYSAHNSIPALAMDCVPVINRKVSWNKLHCSVLSGLIQAAAKEEKVELVWGGNWDRDGEPITDQDFQDLVHYQKVKNV